MELKIPSPFFCGSAVSAVAGLALGLSLHGSWQTKAHAPQIFFSSAEAEDLGSEAKDPAPPALQPEKADYIDDPSQYEGYLPPNPLPVTRLRPQPDPVLADGSEAGEVQTASADPSQRQDADEIASQAEAEQALSSEAPPAAPVRYTALNAAALNAASLNAASLNAASMEAAGADDAARAPSDQ